MWISTVKSAKIRPAFLVGLLALILPAHAFAQPPAARTAQTDGEPGGSPSYGAESKGNVSETSKPRSPVPRTPEEIRRAELASDTKRLYELAIELRAEIAKNKDTLSLAVISKTEEVEKLAKSLRARMAAEAASSKQ